MKLVILDRDGVINQDAESHVRSPHDWEPIPGSLDAIARLTHAGYRIVVVTNQSGLARDYFDLETLNRIHRKMHTFVQEHGGHIDAILFSPYADDTEPTRKPNPGMLVDLATRLQTSLRNVPVVGDSLRDLQAARAVHARPILVQTGNGQHTATQHAGELDNVEIYPDLTAVAERLLTEPRSSRSKD